MPGYDDRRNQVISEQAERLSFPITNISEPFEQELETINMLSNTLLNQIVAPLLNLICVYVGKSEYANKLTDSAGTYFSLVYYPDGSENVHEKILGLRKHKDLGLMTVLSVAEQGLKYFTKQSGEQVWIDVEPLEDYYVIVLGRVLQLLLGKDKCHAASHKVDLTIKERLTLGFFFNPPATVPIANIFTGQESYRNFIPEYISAQINKYRS